MDQITEKRCVCKSWTLFQSKLRFWHNEVNNRLSRVMLQIHNTICILLL